MIQYGKFLQDTLGAEAPDGKFDENQFSEKAQLPQVKMIEIKLSQGAKPGHGECF